jgi:hypothetical protein
MFLRQFLLLMCFCGCCLQMARQVDVLQNQMRKVEESQGPASSSIKIIRPNAPASAVPNPLGAIPPPLPRDSSELVGISFHC